MWVVVVSEGGRSVKVTWEGSGGLEDGAGMKGKGLEGRGGWGLLGLKSNMLGLLAGGGLKSKILVL